MRKFGKILIWTAVAVVGLYFLAGAVSDLRLFHRYEQQQLKHLGRELDQEIAAALDSADGRRELSRLLREKRLVDLELFLRRFYLDAWMAALGAAALIFLFAQWVRGGNRVYEERRVRTAEDLMVSEGQPREEYVDEYEFHRRLAGGFASREEALRWLNDSTASTCDYCGAKLIPPPGKPKSYIELVTFYKKVPAGAKDLRVVMGSGWFAHPAPEVVCGGCGRNLGR